MISPGARIGGACERIKLSLTRAGEFDIDFSQELGIEQCAMLDSPRIVDRVTGTQIIKPVRGSRMFTAGK